MKKQKGYTGFTLAEVLITLSIIGVVASLTIPSLVKDYNEKAMRTKFLAIYRTIIEGNKLLIAEHGDLNGRYPYYHADYMQDLARHVKFTKVCSDKDEGYPAMTSCMPRVQYKYLNTAISGDPGQYWNDPDYTVGVLNNGAVIFQMQSTGYYMDFEIDVNGVKGPNQLGKDLFWFGLYHLTGVPDFSVDDGCDKSSAGKPGKGLSCAFYVINGKNY